MNLDRPALTGGAASLLDERRASRTQSSGLTLLRSGRVGRRCILRVLLLATPLVEGTVASALAVSSDSCGASETCGPGSTRKHKVLGTQLVGSSSSTGRLSGGTVFTVGVCFQGKRLISRLLSPELAGLDIGTTQRLDTVQQFRVGF